MSRVGNAPVQIPSGITVEIKDGVISAKGSKGELTHEIPEEIEVKVDGEQVVVSRKSDEKHIKALHGLTRSLISNIIEGVDKGFEKKLEVNGVGFKVNVSGSKLTLALGYSHNIEYQAPEGVSLAVDQNIITVSGIDKQQVGQEAAKIREFRKPEPYKGKGIKYLDEQIIRKAGKTAAATGE